MTTKELENKNDRMTKAQASYLKTLATNAGEAFDPQLSKSAASKEIDRLKARGESSRALAS